MVRLLPNRGLNPDVARYDFWMVPQPQHKVMPLCDADRFGAVECARELLLVGASVDGDKGSFYSPLAFAAEGKQLAMVHLLLDFGANIEGKALANQAPIVNALGTGIWLDVGQQIAIFLLQRGANPYAMQLAITV